MSAHEPRAERQGAALPDHLDDLPFPARMRELAAHARALSAPEYERIHAALDAGDPYERHLGLHLAVVRRDFAAVERALTDPVLRRRALSAAIRLPVPDRALIALVEDSPPRDRTAVYGVLRRSRRSALADSLVPRVWERYGRAEVARLLPACSPETVGRWLSSTAPDTTLLRRLARTAPAAVTRHLADDPPAPKQRRRDRFGDYRGVLEVLATRAPGELAAVLREVPQLRWMALARDQRMVSVLLTEPETLLAVSAENNWPARHDVRLFPTARHAISALDPEQAARLLTTFGSRPVRARVLEAVPLEERRRVLELAYPGDEMSKHVTAGEIRCLPGQDRVELARRILAESEKPTRGWRHLELAGMLPYAEAAETLSEATASHRYQERRAAWESLLGCAVLEGDPAVFAHAVTEARRAWYDQDSVRVASLQPVVQAPTRLLTAVPASVLQELVAAVTAVRDTTETCFSLVSRWLSRSLTHALTEDADDLHALLVRLHSDPRAPGPPAELRDFGPRLWAQQHSRLIQQVHSGRFDAVFRLAAMTNPGSVPELDELLRTIAQTASDPEQAATAARLWITDPATREDRVGALVEHDPALGQVESVWRVVATRRTDLLGRVLSENIAPPPVPAGRRGRWTPAQRRLAETGATTAAFDTDLPLPERENAVTALSDPDTLDTLADSSPTVAAAALATLPRVAPADQALQILLSRAAQGSGPARRAVVRSLAECIDSLPEPRAIEALRPFVLGDGPVGAAKEAVRLLTNLAGGTELLVAAWRTPGLHRDVRAAVVGALVGLLGEDDRIPGILAGALRDEEAVRVAVTDVHLTRIAADQRPAFARTLADALSTGDPDVIRAYAEWWQYAPDGIALLDPETLVVTTSPAVFSALSSLLCGSADHEDGLRVLRTATDRLVADIDTLTMRRRLEELVSTWSSHFDQAKAGAAARVLADACKRAGMHATAVPMLVHLARLSLSGTPDLDIWAELIATIDERPYRWRSAWQFRTPLSQEEADTALAIADHLITLDGSVPGLLAARLIAAGRKVNKQACHDRLTTLRDHPDPDVRDNARNALFWYGG